MAAPKKTMKIAATRVQMPDITKISSSLVSWALGDVCAEEGVGLLGDETLALLAAAMRCCRSCCARRTRLLAAVLLLLLLLPLELSII